MKSNEKLREQIFEIDNQIRDEEPPETKQTFERLIKMDYNTIDSKKYIVNVFLYIYLVF